MIWKRRNYDKSHANYIGNRLSFVRSIQFNGSPFFASGYEKLFFTFLGSTQLGAWIICQNGCGLWKKIGRSIIGCMRFDWETTDINVHNHTNRSYTSILTKKGVKELDFINVAFPVFSIRLISYVHEVIKNRSFWGAAHPVFKMISTIHMSGGIVHTNQ
jgi:hypothetical protein